MQPRPLLVQAFLATEADRTAEQTAALVAEQNRLRGQAIGYGASLDRVNDLAQQTVTNLLNQLRRNPELFDGQTDGNVEAYSNVVLLNQIVNDPAVRAVGGTPSTGDDPPAPTTPGLTYHSREALYQALAGLRVDLSPLHAELVVGYHLCNVEQRTLARLHNLGESTIRNRLRDALVYLRVRLRGSFPDLDHTLGFTSDPTSPA